MENYFSALPEPIQQVLLVLVFATLLVVLHKSAKQDLTLGTPSFFGAFTAWGFGVIVLGVRLFSATDRPLEFMGLLAIAIVYIAYVVQTVLAFRANQTRQPSHVE